MSSKHQVQLILFYILIIINFKRNCVIASVFEIRNKIVQEREIEANKSTDEVNSKYQDLH